jgi:hypothetical protein
MHLMRTTVDGKSSQWVLSTLGLRINSIPMDFQLRAHHRVEADIVGCRGEGGGYTIYKFN